MGKRDKRERKKRRLNRREFENQITDHHVPPRSHGARYVLQKTIRAHRAYHTLFSNAGSYEECCAILKQNWWTPH